MVHEMGHHLEFSIPGSQKVDHEFLDYRCGNQKLKRLKTSFPRTSTGPTKPVATMISPKRSGETKTAVVRGETLYSVD